MILSSVNIITFVAFCWTISSNISWVARFPLPTLLGLSETNSYEKDELVQEDNDFYTGNLKISNKDFEDFKDIENDIKSNNVLVKVLIFVFIIIVLGIGVVVANNFFNLGLF